LLLSLASFGLVYALNGGGNGESNRIVQALVMPLVDEADTVAGEPAVTPPVGEREKPRLAVFKSEEEKDGIIRRVMIIGRGETLTSRLIMAGITRTEALRAMDALRVYVNPSKIRGGQTIAVLFTRTAQGERFSGFELRAQPSRLVTIVRSNADTFRAQVKDVQPERQRLALRGAVQDSLYESGLKAGVPASVLATLIKTYSYSVDFQRDVRRGDRFEVLFEQSVDEAGRPQGDATMIYAALQVGGRIMPIYRVAMPGGAFEYFDARGESIRKALLRTPVDSVRVTSGFGMRRHPLLGYSRMHKGIDFGAPTGSPIYAAGNGVVEEAGWHSGYGKYVRIRHNGKISSAYAHMSQFGRSIAKGTRVSQGQVIGYVGSTGASTGPHLHYEILVNNEQVNPLTVAVNTSTTLGGNQLVAFQDWRGKIHGQFEQLIAVAETGTRLTSLVQNNTAK
jgi:murein DD-endopeptidase MepM/ murein hydrolase activator NlpD